MLASGIRARLPYTDSQDVDCRWDRHPPGGDYVNVSGLAHFHPPPDASTDPSEIEASCIEQSPAALVLRAVLRPATHTLADSGPTRA